MYRIVTTVILWIATMGMFNAQSVSIEGGDVFENGQICLDVSIEGFQDLIGMEFELRWDSTVIEYSHLTVKTGLNGFSDNSISDPTETTASVGSNILIVGWLDNDLTPRSLPDDDVLFEVCFVAIGTVGSSSTMNLYDLLFIAAAGSIPFDDNDNIVRITNTAGSNLTFGFPTVSADPNESICMPLTVLNFDSIRTFSYGIKWDPAILSFQNIDVGTSLINFSSASIQTFGSDSLTVSWSDNDMTGESLAVGYELLSICFNVVGSPAQSSLLRFGSVSAEKPSGPVVTINTNNGLVIVNSPPIADDLRLSSNDITVNPGQAFCLPVKVNGFVDLTALDFNINWNNSVVSFQNAMNLSSLPGLDISDITTTGSSLSLDWVSPGDLARNLSNGTVLFDVCFNTTGVAGTTSNFEFDAMNATNADGLPVIEIKKDGSITVEIPTAEDVVFSLNTISLNNGEMGCLTLNVNDFVSLDAFSFDINWNPQNLNFQAVNILPSGLIGFDDADITTPTNGGTDGSISVNWSDVNGVGRNLSNGTGLIEICFEADGFDEIRNFIFSGVSVSNTSGLAVRGVGSSGRIIIAPDGSQVPVNFITGNIQLDENTTGCFPVRVNGFTNLLAIEMQINWDNTIFEFTQVQNLTNLSFFNTSNISNPIAGRVVVSWDDNDGTGKTLADNTILFEICGSGASVGSTVAVISATAAEDVNATKTTTVDNGTITVNPVGGSSDLKVSAADFSINVGEQVCVPVKIDGFSDLITGELRLEWNENIVNFDRIQNLASLDFFSIASSFSTPPANGTNNAVIMVWFDNDLIGRVLPNNTTLFEVCFTGTNPGTSALDFVTHDFADVTQNSVPSTRSNGTITVAGDPVGLTVFAGTTTVAPGANGCIPITVKDFENLVTMEFELEWDPNIAEFDRIENLVTSLPYFGATSSISTPPANNTNNKIIVIWLDEDLTGKTLADDTELFRVCFDAIGNAGEETPITFNEVVFADVTLQPVTSTSVAGKYIIGSGSNKNFSCIVNPINTADEDEVVCIPIRVSGFDEIIDLNFSVNWDPAIFSFDEIQSITNVSGLDITDFTVPGTAGTISLAWMDDDNSGEILTDNSILFELCLEAVGNPGDNSAITISDLNVEDVNSSNFTVTNSNGQASINDVNSPSGTFKLLVGDNEGDRGTQQCVTVSVESFNNISSVNYRVEWDNSILTYRGVNILASIPGFDDNSILDPNEMPSLDNTLVFDWDHPSGGTATLTSPSDLFEICFDLSGQEGAVSAVDVKNIIVTDASGGTINVLKEDGNIRISSDPDNGLVSIIAPVLEGNRGEEICVDFKVKNFVDIISTEFRLSWNSDIISYSRHLNLAALPGFGSSSISTPDDHSLIVLWLESSLSQQTLADDDIFITICFNLIGAEGTGSALNFDDTEFSRDGTALDHILVDGFISIASTTNGEIKFALSEETVAPGTEACVKVSTENFTDINIVDLEFGWDDQVLVYSNVNIIAGVPGLDISNFTSTSTNRLDLSWVNPASTGITLANGAVLFEICYNTIGNSGSSSLVFISDGQVLNKTGDNLNIVSDNGRVELSNELGINSVEIDSISCNGRLDGSIEITVTGGQGNYIYSWDPSVSTGPLIQNLNAGIYSVTVTDGAGSSVMRTFEVFEPAILRVDPVITGVTPPNEDGVIDLNVSGGTPPYSIDWCCSLTDDLQIQRDLAQGNYNAVITDAKGCELIIDEIELNGTLFVMSTITTELQCDDSDNGAIEITIDGGQEPYFIIWSDGVNNIGNNRELTGQSKGTYFYTITDSNVPARTRSGSVELLAPPAITVNILINPETNAGNDGSLLPTASGGNPGSGYIYNWFNYATSSSSTNRNQLNLSSGYYRLDVLDANFCRVTLDSIFLGGGIFVPIDGLIIDEISCFGECDGGITINPQGGTGNYVYNYDGTGITSSNTKDGICAGVINIIIEDVNNGDVTVVQVTLNNPDPIIINAMTIGVVNGNDGGIILDIEGGTEPYSFEWSPINENRSRINGLTTGFYSVTVTDINGCEAELENIEVSVRSLFISIVNVEDVLCTGDTAGSITVNVTGGCRPYDYFWRVNNVLISMEEDISNVPDGVYELQVIDRCMETLFSDEIIISALSTLSIEIEAIEDYSGFGVSGFGLNDGSVRVVINGGTGGLDILWSTGSTDNFISDLGEGTYSVTVTDALGCRKESSITINAPDELILAFEILAINDCSNEMKGVVQALVSGGVQNYSFNWSNGGNGLLVDGLPSGYTSVTVTDANNVTIIDSVFINFETDFDIDTIIRPDLGNSEGAITLLVNGGAGGYTFQWNDRNNSTTSSISGLLAGSYTVVITDRTGCSVLLIIEVPLNGDAPDCLEVREVFTPNGDGKNDFFVVNCINNFVNNIQIFNRYGDLIFEQENYNNLWNGKNSSGELLPQGAYFYILNVINADGGKELRKGHITIIR